MKQTTDTGFVAQPRFSLAQRAEVAEQMRIAPQLGGRAKLRESAMQIGQETARGTSILIYGAGLKREGERLDFLFEQLFQID
jgi:hypothetical protein